MPKYVVERELAGIGNVTPDQIVAISQKSCSIIKKLGPTIQLLHSYITDDKLYCVYIAPNEDMIRAHAMEGDFPTSRISEVRTVFDPTWAEGLGPKKESSTK